MARQAIKARRSRSMTKRVNSATTHHAVTTAAGLSGLKKLTGEFGDKTSQ